MKTNRQRRKFFVHFRYQLSQLAVTLTANTLVMLLIGVLISWFYLLFFKGNLTCNHNRIFPLYLVISVLAMILFSALWSLKRSRAVAGMMCKLEYVLCDAAQDLFPEQPLVFRKGDYFTTLAGPLNACLVRMKKQEHRRETAIRTLRELQIACQAEGADREELHRRIDTIIGALENETDNQ